MANLIDNYSIKKIDLLKIDAERSEREILRGIRANDWSRIRQIVVEVHEGEIAKLETEQILVAQGFDVACDPNPHFPNLFMLYGTRQMS